LFPFVFGTLLFGGLLIGVAHDARWVSGIEGVVVGRETRRTRHGDAHYLLVATREEERAAVRVSADAYRACADGSALRRAPGSVAIECGDARYAHLALGATLVAAATLAAFVVAVASGTLAAALYRRLVWGRVHGPA